MLAIGSQSGSGLDQPAEVVVDWPETVVSSVAGSLDLESDANTESRRRTNRHGTAVTRMPDLKQLAMLFG